LLAGAGLDQVIVAADIGAIPPTRFDALRALQDLHARLGQQGRLGEQPAGALHVVQSGARGFIGRRLPGTFGAVVGVKAQAVYRLIAKPGAQAFA